uniref:Uncharacterized protein n=1 Tax=Anguilla anguilla TaxID=7936 RepID=A0A0E9QK24_ANGAN
MRENKLSTPVSGAVKTVAIYVAVQLETTLGKQKNCKMTRQHKSALLNLGAVHVGNCMTIRALSEVSEEMRA